MRLAFSISLLLAALPLVLLSCSVSKQISRSAKTDILDNKALKTAHIGISLYDPAAGKYLYNYQGDKYFVPASNTKIPTCYAAMKYLGDSLVGARYEERGKNVYIYGTADPTFFHPDYAIQPVLQYIKSKKGLQVQLCMNTDSSYSRQRIFREYGPGWSWNDYDESYMPQRSFFPIHGNIVSFAIDNTGELVTQPAYFRQAVWFIKNDTVPMKVVRDYEQNSFVVTGSKRNSPVAEIPFQVNDRFVNNLTNGIMRTPDSLLSDLAGYPIIHSTTGWQHKAYKIIHSQPTDSLLKPMMHRSDNFFAEQSLLMVSNEHIGYMSDAAIIDTLLKTDFRDLPQKPRWVDGSGLSRYNLFTPQDLIAILYKMQKEFGMDRVKNILPTGGEGTISSYYKADSGYIFVKTGTLSGVVALSGFLYTKKGKEIIFSILINNHQASATEVRRAVEKFIQGVRNKY